MLNKPHHEVLVFKKTVWLSVLFDMERGTQCWSVYKRTWRSCTREWWLGLVPKCYIPGDLKNENLPKPILKAYAFTEWTLEDTLQRPNGTDLWVEYDPPNKFLIWWSPLNWDDVLETGKHDWECAGVGFWESE